MRRPATWLALLWVAGALGCRTTSQTPLQTVAPRDLGLAPCSSTLAVAPLRDLRSAAEREGGDVDHQVAVWVVPLWIVNILGYHHTWSGSHALEATSEQIVKGATWGLRHHLQATGCFDEVIEESGGANYVLETEILHCSASAFERGHTNTLGALVLVGSGAATGSNKSRTTLTLIHGTASLRLRLRDSAGRVLAKRVVSNAVLRFPGAKGIEPYRVAQCAKAALSGALIKSVNVVASWVQELRLRGLPPAEIRRRARTSFADEPSFLLSCLEEDRVRTTFCRLRWPDGLILSTWRADGIPPVGRPGEWLLSPYDQHGLRIPRRLYSERARLLSERFRLRRVDEFSSYHYFGPRGP
jgi:hypothetical protein